MSTHTADPHPRRWLILALVSLAQVLIVLDATIVNVALPAIGDDLGLSNESLQWTINAYTLAFGGFLLLGGRAADLFGRRRLFLAGVVLFTVASALNALAESGAVLIAGRALQGLGGALVAPAALSIVTTTFTDHQERTKALAVWGVLSAAGGAFGLLLGGMLTEWLTWEWIFVINAPIGVFAVVATLRVVPESRVLGARGFDVLGAVTVTAGLVLVVFAITKASAWGFGDTRVVAVAAAGVALLAAFVAVERRHSAPLVRLGLLRVRPLTLANITVLLAFGGVFTMFFFSTLYLQRILGYSPLEAGLAFLPFTVTLPAGAAVGQTLVQRGHAKASVILGLTFAAVGLAWWSRMSVDGSFLGDVLGPTLVLSFGMGNLFVALTLIATAPAPADEQGLASGLFNTSQQLGGAVMLAVLGTVAAEHTAQQLEGARPDPAVQAAALVDGFQLGLTLGAALLVATLVLVAVALPKAAVDALDPDLLAAAAPA